MRLLAAYEPDGFTAADVGRRAHVVHWAVAGAGRAALRVTPPFVAERVRRTLQVAGYGRPETMERYLAAELVLLAAGLPSAPWSSPVST